MTERQGVHFITKVELLHNRWFILYFMRWRLDAGVEYMALTLQRRIRS